jgi:peptidoglycan DL-endopeptidase CwlO
MKRMSTAPVSSLLRARSRRSMLAKSLLMTAALVVAVGAPLQMTQEKSYADKYDEQIAAIQRQIDSYQSEASNLATQADTLERKIAILRNQEATIQAQIDKSQKQYNKVVAEIEANKQRIEENREALGETIANIYVDDEVTPLELLASSDSIGDYVDKQEYRAAIRDNLVETIDEIRDLQAKLEKQELELAQILEDQKNQRSVLAAKRSERSAILAETRGKESAYNSLIAQGKSEQDKLAAQQRAAIAAQLAASGVSGQAVAGDPNMGGYPRNLYNAPRGALVDPWGMYNRECVSYTAWRVYQKNGSMPYWGGVGNAYEWPGNADRAGIPRGSTPRPGSVGVMAGGPWGHVVWVESVNANGTINISQFNEGVTGHYSERYNVNPATYYTYIYF